MLYVEGCVVIYTNTSGECLDLLNDLLRLPRLGFPIFIGTEPTPSLAMTIEDHI